MGSAASKQREKENTMEGDRRAKSVSASDKKLKNKHGSQLMSPKVKEMEDIIPKGARATEDEPIRPDIDFDGPHRTYNSRSVKITNFDYGDISKLEGYFQRKYRSDFKQVKEDGLGFMIVEFKSRQVAERVVKSVHEVDGTILEITFDSTPMTKDDVATKDKGKEQGVTAIDARAKKDGHLYPFDEMRRVKMISQEGNLLSKEKSSNDTFKPEPHNNGHLTMSANEQSSRVMAYSMPDNVGDEEDKMGKDPQQAKVRNGLPNISAREFRTAESVDEMTIEVDAVKVEFIKKVHRIEYDEIGHSNNVIIEHDAESHPGMVTFRTNGPRRGNVECAYEQFMELYHRISATLSRNNAVNVLKELPDCTIRSLTRALTLANADDRVLVKNCLSDDFNVVFYGSETNVANAIANFIENSGKQDDAHTSDGNPRPQSHKQTTETQVYAHVRTLDEKHFVGTVSDITISVYEGDLTQEKVDVVVNAANERLYHAGGVALAISEAGGQKIQKESSEYVTKHGTLPIGQAMHTGAGKMPCKYVIHTVGPKWKDHADKETVQSQLYEALFNVLHYAANRLKARSIAIPAISAGIYGVPVDICAVQLVLATQKFVQSPPANNTLRDIRFVNIDGQINSAFVRVFSGSFPSNDSGAHYYEAIGDEDCPICMDKVVQPKRLGCCSNVFCTDCIDKAFQVKPVCPICGYQSRALKGTQPKTATMTFAKTSRVIPGYEECGSIQIYYDIPSGIQEDCHPNPGRPYKGSMRMAFLPDNTEGQKVLQLLKKAFDRRLVFTIGTSVTTGKTDAVIWNDIHHKTSPYGGPSNYGYPDRGYLRRVTDELAAKGIK
ncbi:uncharacterized protein LOC118406310 [Branchiostoma floridae]|uniref:E3 ubiquitin-protein ligase n=1 Tax=Branchiostoma floridae TaxID=7739 RepID=A0A9J7HPP4_BRAFL|nr:uncharacterized protein LOC118406310 [Branchiostoma floridae]